MLPRLQVLDLVSPKQSDVICTAALQHSDKNRLKDFLLCNYLTPKELWL